MLNTHEESVPDTLIIENPFTGKLVNILPILALSDKTNSAISGLNIGKSSAAKAMDESIRLISTRVEADIEMEEVRMLIYSLYEIRDAFNGVTEFEQIKKGAGYGK